MKFLPIWSRGKVARVCCLMASSICSRLARLLRLRKRSMGGRPGVTSWLAEPAPGAAAGSSHLASVVKASAPSWHWFSVVPGQGEPHIRAHRHTVHAPFLQMKYLVVSVGSLASPPV